jgi:proteic killer suppression protein
MIVSFKHKALERFFVKGTKKGLHQNHVERIGDQLTALHTAMQIEDMEIPGWHLHPLKGDRKDKWAVNVSKNWRIVFKFENGNAYVVDYEDYH